MDESTSRKVCTKCGVEKDFSRFAKLSGDPTKLRTACKDCAIESARLSQQRIKAAPKRLPASGTKACSRCKVVQPLSEFHRRAVSSDGRTSKCKGCSVEERRAYCATNPEKIAAYGAKWRKRNPDYLRQWRAENPELNREYSRQWALKHPEQIAAAKRAWWEANRERLAERLRTDPDVRARRLASFAAYRERHREVLTERQRRRRVDRLGLTVADVDLDALWDGRCGLCGRSLDRELRWPDPQSKSIDNIIPLVHGGTHEAHNLTWAHLFCNLSKGARLPAEAAPR